MWYVRVCELWEWFPTPFSNQKRKRGPTSLQNPIKLQEAWVRHFSIVMLKKDLHIDLWESCAFDLSKSYEEKSILWQVWLYQGDVELTGGLLPTSWSSPYFITDIFWTFEWAKDEMKEGEKEELLSVSLCNSSSATAFPSSSQAVRNLCKLL